MIDDFRRQVKTPECRGCGRVYIDHQWRYQVNVKPDEIACCPSCLRAEEERDELLRESNRRKAASGGYSPATGYICRGFRDGK